MIHLDIIEKPRVLVVEGKDDEFFLGVLATHLKLHDLQIWSVEGKHNIATALNLVVTTRGFEELRSLGVIRDADDDPRAASQSLDDAYQRSKLAAVATSRRPRFGYFLLPDNNNPGMLEDACLATVGDDVKMACVKAFIKCLFDAGTTLKQPAKTAVYAFLAAAQATPDPRIGLATKQGVWNLDHDCLAPLCQFLCTF